MRSIWASLPSGSGSTIGVARSLLDLRQSRELCLGEAEDPAPLPSLDAVSAGSFSSAGPGPPGGSRFDGF